jgi:hypothetical protein
MYKAPSAIRSLGQLFRKPKVPTGLSSSVDDAIVAPNGEVGQLLRQITGPGQRLAGQLVTKIRRAAGFADEGIPLIIDSNSMRRGMAEQLRARGYNVRTVTEIFGTDPGDPAIKSLAETLGGRVLTNNMTDFGRDIAIRMEPRATSIESWIRLRRQEAAAILAGCTAGRMDVAEAKSRRVGTRPAEPELTFQRDGVRLVAERTFRLATRQKLGFGRSSATRV